MRQYVITYSNDSCSHLTVYQETFHDKADLESELKYLKESSKYSLISVKVSYS